MMYEIESFLDNFAYRIIKNNEIIEENAFILNDGYEITQEVTSLTALLTVCLQKYEERRDIEFDPNSPAYGKIEDLINELYADHRLFCNYRVEYSIFHNGKTDVKSFIRHLRNSLAHGGTGLNFFPVDTGNVNGITDIYLRDTDQNRLFCVKLSVAPSQTNGGKVKREDHITRLIENISALYRQREKSISGTGNRLTRRYFDEITQLDKVLNGEPDAERVYIKKYVL